MVFYIALLLWFGFTLLLSPLLAKQMLQKCQTHLHFHVHLSTEPQQTNERKKLEIQVKNDGIAKVLLTELGIEDVDSGKRYSFHKLIEHSASLPNWLEPNKTLNFVQYVIDVPMEFRQKERAYVIYAKDDHDKLYVQDGLRKDQKIWA